MSMLSKALWEQILERRIMREYEKLRLARHAKIQVFHEANDKTYLKIRRLAARQADLDAEIERLGSKSNRLIGVLKKNACKSGLSSRETSAGWSPSYGRTERALRYRFNEFEQLPNPERCSTRYSYERTVAQLDVKEYDVVLSRFHRLQQDVELADSVEAKRLIAAFETGD